MSDTERRGHARIAVERSCTLVGPSGSTAGAMRDVSAVGACVVTDERVATDDDAVELRVDAPSPLEVAGRVMYARERGGAIVTGIQFVDLDADRYRAVTGFIAALLDGGGGGKREHPRVQHRVQVVCRTPHRALGVLQDVSRGGMRVVVEGAVATGDELTAEVTIGKLAKPLVLSGTVVRVKAADDGARHLAGVKLGPLSPEAERLLGQLLDALTEAPAS